MKYINNYLFLKIIEIKIKIKIKNLIINII